MELKLKAATQTQSNFWKVRSYSWQVCPGIRNNVLAVSVANQQSKSRLKKALLA